MDDNKFDDLKQFIDTRISQDELRFEDKIDVLERHVGEGFAGVGDAIEEVHKQLDERDANIAKRLT